MTPGPGKNRCACPVSTSMPWAARFGRHLDAITVKLYSSFLAHPFGRILSHLSETCDSKFHPLASSLLDTINQLLVRSELMSLDQ